ncbi:MULTISPECIES: MbtH family protein [unclassified Nonomuraea]|uniref:MbtH family protein n=1 Tax=unclassified Nonomuraea TaxID=2593643 RepID=UPI0033E02089
MTNPFESDNDRYFVLVNAERQHSLWPVTAAVPAGWSVAHGGDTRDACLRYVEQNWTDLRPAGLAAEMDGTGTVTP